MAIHIISDLHLATDSQDLNKLFLQTLQQWKGNIEALYILGDLFEYWIGDDDDNQFNQSMIQVMRDFAESTPIFIMRGNRDFLLGDTFAKQTGCHLLEDPSLITAYGQKYLLSHGDIMCTDDKVYQQFRAQRSQIAWQQAMLAKPLAERRAIAEHARINSQANKEKMGLTDISDVTIDGIHALCTPYPNVILIHGHTHRPQHHQHDFEDVTLDRWVIADWRHKTGGGYLKIDQNGVKALPLNLP